MGFDRISELPDSLVTQILLNLATKDSVKTSVLSTRWRNLWLNVPGLDLTVNDFTSCSQVFSSFFIDKYTEFNHKSRMQKFKIKYHVCNEYTRDRFLEWIGTAVDRGIQHLDVETDIGLYMPQNIYNSNTLVSLKLVFVGIETPPFVVSLPCLKIVHLQDVWYEHDPLLMDKIISGCPVLEDLTLIRTNVYLSGEVLLFLRVRSQTLKSFRLTFEDNSICSTEFSVDIDAPRLEYLSFKDNQSDRIVIKNLSSSLFKIDIDSEFNAKYGNTLDPKEIMKRNTICDFLSEISSVRHMIISQRTIEVLFLYCNPILEFNNLYRLQAAFCSSMLQLLPIFLESCPNLKDLILDFAVSTEPEQTELTYVPHCLLSSLECVEIRELIMEEEPVKKLVRYFLENSLLLKKLILRFKDSSIAKQDSDILEELRTFTKRSRKCQIIIH